MGTVVQQDEHLVVQENEMAKQRPAAVEEPEIVAVKQPDLIQMQLITKTTLNIATAAITALLVTAISGGIALYISFERLDERVAKLSEEVSNLNENEIDAANLNNLFNTLLAEQTRLRGNVQILLDSSARNDEAVASLRLQLSSYELIRERLAALETRISNRSSPE